MKIIFTWIVLFISFGAFAQQGLIHKDINWSTEKVFFEDASYIGKTPFYIETIPLNNNGRLSAKLKNLVFEKLSISDFPDKDRISESISLESSLIKARSKYFAKIKILPIRRNGSQFEKLVSFDIEYEFVVNNENLSRGPDNKFTSALSNGEIYKIGVSNEGIYALDYTYLKDSLGMDIDNVNADNIQVFSSGGGIVNQELINPRIDDLDEIPVLIQGANNGKLSSDGRIVFFAEGSDKWSFSQTNQKYTYINNPYADSNFYFIKIGSDTGKRIQSKVSDPNPTYTSNEFDGLYHFEEDLHNLLHERRPTHGSGTRWYGDKFSELNNQKSYDFVLPNLNTSKAVNIDVQFLSRSNVSNYFNISIGDDDFKSTRMNGVSLDTVEGTNANLGTVRSEFMATSDNVNLELVYPLNNGSSEGMLDFITLVGRQQLALINDQLSFSDKDAYGNGVVKYQIGNSNSNTVVWDVSYGIDPVERKVDLNGSDVEFSVLMDSFKKFVAFDSKGILLKPISGIKIENQNLHALEDVELLILSPNVFLSEANRLAEHRRMHDGLKVEVVDIENVYNEFSSGRLDPSGIRDFVKMIYDRNSNFKYVLLFGDGSFDYKNIYNTANHSNFIPVYETDSFTPLYSYPSDDFYALLDPTEGGKNLKGGLDMAVGRLVVKDVNEARYTVDKLIDYDTNPKSFGNWRNKMVFVADDEDDNLHIDPVEEIAVQIDTLEPEFNKEKIYLDAFQQISTSGGEKYPDATTAINKNMFKGGLVVNYMGHGGPTGWAQERVLRLEDIDSWENKYALPLFVTATCSFTSYDDFSIVSPGERTFLNNKGGGIGLFTTVRAVYANSNEVLTKNVFNTIFEQNQDGSYLSIGEVLKNSKNSSGAGNENSRKFALIGDPSMKLAIPKFGVSTTHVNGHVYGTVVDTLRAFDKVNINGQVHNNGQILSDFNGQVSIIIYDKPIELSTLGQDAKSQVKKFEVQKNIIFNGLVSVTNGLFEYNFIVPKDINYEFGYGKISYYAWNESLIDARGVNTDIIVGGGSQNAVLDQNGPSVDVFMNDEQFVFGGLTDENPVLLAKIKDESGINLTGASVGHNLTGILDDDISTIYQLNDFYTGAIDDYTQGTVRFPLFDIEAGRHKLSVTAWDIANNRAEGYTEFVVANSEKMALEHVLNYPNPFTTHTDFQFEHNFPGQTMNVQIRIFSVNGKLVKTIKKDIVSDAYRVDDISWNGDDEFGTPLARGVYLYKVNIGTDNGSEKINTESAFEKLVILK